MFETIASLQQKIKSGELTLTSIVNAYRAQIEKTENQLTAFISHDWDMVTERITELESVENKEALPLYGMPIGVKDVFAIQGTQTTAGSKILEGYIAPYTATAIQKLLDAGAVVMGKNNCDEFAMGGSTENSGYFSSKNPYDITRVPGGSSGGTAVSIAAGQVVAGIGSDTGGSIRQPAAFCGIVGLKPTYGAISRNGLIAMASSLDCVGPMTRSVDDAALLFDIMAGKDPLDSTSHEKTRKTYTDITTSIADMNIGIPKEINLGSLSQPVQDQFNQAVAWLKDGGAKIHEISLPHLADALAVYYVLMPAEVSSNMARFDGLRYGQAVSDAQSLLDYYMDTRGTFLGDEVKRRIMIGTYMLSSGYVDAYYKNAQKVRQLIVNDFASVYTTVDAILMPTTPTTAFALGAKNDNPLEMYLADIYTVSANIAGVPAISVPTGLVDGLPFGVQFLGPHFKEEVILSLAKHVETTRGELSFPNIQTI